MPKLSDATKTPANIKDLVPAFTSAQRVSAPPIQSAEPTYEPLSLAPPPAVMSTDSDRQRQYFRHGVTQFRIPPLPAKANQAVGAQARTIATQVAGSGGGSGNLSIFLEMPEEFSVTGSPAEDGGGFTVAWSAEPPGTVFGVPTSAYQAVGADTAVSNTVSGSSITVSTTPTLTGDYALFLSFGTGNTGGGSGGAPTGFTLLDAATGLSGALVSGTDRVTVSSSIGAISGVNQFISAALCLVQTGGATPSIIQSAVTSGGFSAPTSISVPLSSAVTANSSLLVVIEASAGSYGANASADFGSVSDNKRNGYQRLTGSSGSGGGAGVFTVNTCSVWLASGVAAGSTTITVPVSVSTGSVIAGVRVKVFEMAGILPATSQTPRFLEPFATMGPISLALVGAGGGISGILGLANGGTGADLTTTGGTSQVVVQTSVGAPLSVTTFDYDKLPGAALATTYNNVTLHGLGLVSITGVANSTSNAADIAATNLLTGAPSGLFRVTFYMCETQAASVSSTLPNLTIRWFDPDNNTAQFQTFVPATPNGNSLTTFLLGNLTVYNKPGAAAITYETAGYASVGGTPMTYSVHIRVEQLGF